MARILAAFLIGLTVVGAATAATIRGSARADRIQAVDGKRQTIACGRGLDIVDVDAVDVVRGDCETVARRVGVDPTAVPVAQHSTIVEPDSFAAGSTVVSVYQVGRFVDGGAGATGWSSSTDGGRTWRSGLLPGVGRASDPVVAYDAAHSLWIAATLGITTGPTSIDVSRSTDGRRWSGPSHALNAQTGSFDKQWVVCDNAFTSPRRGTCYIAYTDIVVNRIAVVSSTDGGLTWTAPVFLPGNDVVGAQPVALPDGTLVVAWIDGNEIVAARSTDGGATFAAAVLVAGLNVAGVRDLRAPPLPSIEIDRRGRILLAWPDCRFRPGCTGNDVVVATSADGLAWSAPVRVTLGGGSYFVPGIAADTATDRLAVVALVVLSDGRIGAVLVRSPDGVRWSAPRRLDARPMSFAWLARAGGAFLGDYLSASWVRGRAFGFVPMALPPRSGAFRQALYAATTR